MKDVLPVLLPGDAPTIALPGWRRWRLVIPAFTPGQRWRDSARYNASRWQARVWRIALRAKAALGLGTARLAHEGWPLGDFVADVLPDTASASVMRSGEGPYGRAVVELRDQSARPVAYVKFASGQPEMGRLEHERDVLRGLPVGVGPAIIKAGQLRGGFLIVLSPIEGRWLPRTLPPPPRLVSFLADLVRTEDSPFDDNPFVCDLRQSSGVTLDSSLDPLRSTLWPLSYQHGDFAPWNCLVSATGAIRVIDWEYGHLRGLPYLDLVHYMLQVAGLVYRWAPARTLEYVSNYLASVKLLPCLSGAAARAFVRFVALADHAQAQRDGTGPHESIQRWRMDLWRLQS